MVIKVFSCFINQEEVTAPAWVAWPGPGPGYQFSSTHGSCVKARKSYGRVARNPILPWWNGLGGLGRDPPGLEEDELAWTGDPRDPGYL